MDAYAPGGMLGLGVSQGTYGHSPQDALGYQGGAYGSSYGSLQATADKRYQDVLAGYQKQLADYGANRNEINNVFSGMYKGLDQYGASQRLGLQQNYQQQLGATQQNLVNRGLGNSSILASAQQGANSAYVQQGLQLNDQLLANRQNIGYQRANYLAQAQQGQAGIQGQQLGYMGQNQQAIQGYGAQAGMGYDQLMNQSYLARLQSQTQGLAQAQQASSALQLQNNAAQNQMNYANQFGYY